MKIQSVRLRNFLGFGESGLDLTDLGPREVIVGANGSGKSSVLHAVEFVGKAFKSEIADGRAYVHRGDWARSIQVDIGVELEPEESRAISTILTYGVTSEQSQLNPEWRVGQQALNRMIRAALAREPCLFHELVSRRKLLLKVSSLAGVGQALRTGIEFRAAHGSLFLGRNGTLSNVDRELTGWSNFDFEREVLTEAAQSAPDLFTTQPADLERIARAITASVQGWTPARIGDRLRSHEPIPTALRLEPVPTFVDRPDMEGGDPDLIQLRTMLADRGYTNQSVSVFDFVSRAYNWSFISLSDSRSRPDRIPIQAVGTPTEYDPNVTGQGLPLLLFFLKNNLSVKWRNQYAEIQHAFEHLTKLRFDVALNPEYEAETSTGQATTARLTQNLSPGTPAPAMVLKHYPYIVFEESGYSYLIDFAASGFFEILLVLATTLGPSNCVVLLDEPVLNLHPSKQRELYSFLSNGAAKLGNQLLVVTHSSTFVSVDDLGKAIRFDRFGGESRSRRLETSDSWQSAQTVKELERMPRLLEALFSRAVVLVEGGAEAAALPIWFEKCPGGSGLSGSGVLFLDVGGDTHFGALKRILDGWGISLRIVADLKAKARVEQFGDIALTYPFADFADLLRDSFGKELPAVVAEVGGSGGDKDPAVARVLATRTEPPLAIVELWERLEPFILDRKP